MATQLSRRSFLSQAAAVAAAGAVAGRALPASGAPAGQTPGVDGPVLVSTWPFGRVANEVAMATLASGTLLDAVEQGIRAIEADPDNHSVGLGGTPNADGVVQLDACIMDGDGHRAGAVAALEDILHPISVARRVMERTRHVMLVGAGARQFALDQGFEATELLTPDRRQAWEAWRASQAPLPKLKDSHDTIALLGRGADGALAGGCSTSGWGYKLPGRVGDSPIIGSGLYVEGKVGAAGATGTGENVMRHCGSFLVVEWMAQGASPQQACVEAVRAIARRDPRPLKELDVHFVAVDRSGRHGAAGTGAGFQYSVATRAGSQLIQAEVVD